MTKLLGLGIPKSPPDPEKVTDSDLEMWVDIHECEVLLRSRPVTYNCYFSLLLIKKVDKMAMNLVNKAKL